MGVRTNLLAIVPTANGLASAEKFGADYAGLLEITERALEGVIVNLQYLVNDPLSGVSSESSNITALNTAITALS
jgi:hypothetical protein